jgi:hypothetical protein
VATLGVAAINPPLAATFESPLIAFRFFFFFFKFQLNTGNTKVAAIEGSSAATPAVAAINPLLAATFQSPVMAF